MMRRTSLSFTHDQGRGVVGEVAQKLARELDWSADRKEWEVRDFLALVGNAYTRR